MNLKRHLLPILILFGGQLAVTIYIQSDITMLGFFYSDARLVKAANTFCRAFAGRGDQGAY